jgi:hypothetical protein
MTRRDEVLTLLARNADGLTDAELAQLTGASHPTINFGNGVQPSHRPAAAPYCPDWFWEGNVQAGMVRYLSAQGAVIRSVADTASKAILTTAC